MPQNESMRKFLRRSIRILAILWLSIACAAGLIHLYQTYEVKQIVVTVDSGEVTNLVGLADLRGVPILILDEKSVARDLQLRNSSIQSISVDRSFPSTLKIRITVRKPHVALQVSDGGTFLLDREGVILNRTLEYTGPLPILKYYQTFPYKQYQVGDKIDYNDLVTALYFVEQLNGFGYPAKRIDIDGLYMIRLLVSEDKMFFATSEKDREVQMYQLKELLRQFKIQGKDFKTIDLRFDKPVITIK